MKRSDQIDEIADALAQAQAEMKNPTFDSANPHFKNRFASLAAVRNAAIPVLAKQGISLIQELTSDERGVGCLTILSHKSGQWMEIGPLYMPVGKADPQGFGSASTYCKRYSLMAVCGCVGDEDDDGNAASHRPAKASTEPQKPSPTQALTEAATVAQGGTEALKAWFGGLTKSEREAIAASPEWTSIKAAAAKVQP